jgi:hypothetical protein
VASIPSNVEHISVIPASDQKSIANWHDFRSSVGSNFKLASDLGLGVYQAMNIGIDSSSGEYICFWNAGDELISLNNTLQQTLQVLIKEKPGWLLVKGVYDWRDSDTTNLDELKKFIHHKKGAFISHQTTIASKNYFECIGNFSSKFKIAADTAAITLFSQMSDPLILDLHLVKVEKPNFAAKNNRRGRLESLVIALICLHGKPRLAAIKNIFDKEIQSAKRKFLRMNSSTKLEGFEME